VEVDEALVLLLSDFMGLPRTHCFLGAEGIKAPTDGLFIVVSQGPGVVIGRKSEFVSRVNPIEIFHTIMQADVQIDICSFDRSANERKEEIIMAISGIMSQSMQESLGMKFSIPRNFLDLTAIEGASNLHRFRISVKVNYVKRLEKDALSYYDKHRTTEVI
jgi:hypothetical protein